MKLQEVYEKYKHLDGPLSEDGQDSFNRTILHDLWLAIKEHVDAPNE
jgi:hypothetical protein